MSFMANSTEKAVQTMRNKFFYQFPLALGVVSSFSGFEWFDVGRVYPANPMKDNKTSYEKENRLRTEAVQVVQPHMCPTGQRIVMKQLIGVCGESVVNTGYISVETVIGNARNETGAK